MTIPLTTVKLKYQESFTAKIFMKLNASKMGINNFQRIFKRHIGKILSNFEKKETPSSFIDTNYCS